MMCAGLSTVWCQFDCAAVLGPLQSAGGRLFRHHIGAAGTKNIGIAAVIHRQTPLNLLSMCAACALAGRRLADGTMLYGCTCNLSVDFGACDQDFDVSFTGVRRLT